MNVRLYFNDVVYAYKDARERNIVTVIFIIIALNKFLII